MKKVNKKVKKTIILAKKVVKKAMPKMLVKVKTKVKPKLIIEPKVNAKTKSGSKIVSKAKSVVSSKTKTKAKIVAKVKTPVKISASSKNKVKKPTSTIKPKKIIIKKPTASVKTKKVVVKQPAAPVKIKKIAVKKLAVSVKAKKIATTRLVSPSRGVAKSACNDKAKQTGRVGTTKKVIKVIKKKVDKVNMTQISKPIKSGNLNPTVDKPYSSHTEEEYMNEQQIAHFKQILLAWKESLMESVDNTMHHMQDDAANYPDPVDRASQEEGFSLELRTRDRERKLLKKIDETLVRINEQDYGYCDDCGAEIGIRRLEARPTANQCIECKTIAEIREKQIGEIN